MDKLQEIATKNQTQAWAVIRDTDIFRIWESAGAEVQLVGSLKTGLLMKHKDIDFHVYSTPLTPANSFAAMAKLAEHPAITHIEYRNLIETEEKCLEWHADYCSPDHGVWKIDIIHILKGSFFDGYFERVAERITAVLTPEMRETILRLKYETPDTANIMGIEYCQAVIQGHVSTYDEFKAWRKAHPATGVIQWMP